MNFEANLSQTMHGGTLTYMAPEIIKGEPYDRKADVYAFGILMFEVVTDSKAYPDVESGKISRIHFMKEINLIL